MSAPALPPAPYSVEPDRFVEGSVNIHDASGECVASYVRPEVASAVLLVPVLALLGPRLIALLECWQPWQQRLDAERRELLQALYVARHQGAMR